MVVVNDEACRRQPSDHAASCGARTSRRQLLAGGAAMLLGGLLASGCEGTAEATPTTGFATPAEPGIGTVIASISSLQAGGSFDFMLPNGRTPAILVRQPDGNFAAYTSICTHQGCTVIYQPARSQFICPCHGSTFAAADGSLKKGPAISGLFKVFIEVDEVAGVVRFKGVDWAGQG